MSGETIRFVDTTLRDGNQSLWGATGITTPMVLAIAPTLDRVGFAALDFSSSTHMAISVRYHKENPFERIRQTRRLMPRTPLSFITTGMRFISWDRAPESLMRLSFRLVIRAGIRRVQIAEPMNDAAAALRLARMVREEGAEEIVPALAYTISPVHSDRFYVEHARALAASPDVDAVYLKDPGGLLTPERISALVPAIQRELGGKRLELHSHCNTGLAPVCYVDAARLGVHWLHTAVGPLANDTSQPSAENIVRNLRALGLGADLDLDAMERVAIHFRQIAHRHRLPLGAPMEYDVAYYKHQVPGGMMTTLKRQLAEIHQLERLPQVLEEVAEIRRELGFPIMVTPFSQFAGAQAVLNVASGKGRYDDNPRAPRDGGARLETGLTGRNRRSGKPGTPARWNTVLV